MVVVYGRPGVKATCLDLQDHHGQCVCYLLWAGWAAARGRFVDAAALSRCSALSRSWENEKLRPARSAIAAFGLASDPDARARLAAQALEIERGLVSALEAETPQIGTEMSVAAGLDAAVNAWGRPAPASALAFLADAFSAP